MPVKPLNDQSSLLAKIANGDEHAFKMVYDHYFNNLYAYALYVIKSETMAEELVQETFLNLWLKNEKLTKIINLESYLVTSVRNRAVDHLRKIKLEVKHNERNTLNWSEEHNETEESILLNESKRILDTGISQLPPQQKMAYILCYQQGLKYDEAARAMNISPETVKSYMKIALKSLRDFLRKHSDLAILAIIFRL